MEDEGSNSDDFLEPIHRNESGQVPSKNDTVSGDGT
jgi:hypothetical protein